MISNYDDLGIEVYIESTLNDVELLFGECSSVILVTIEKNKLHELILISKKHDVFTQTIGRVTTDSKLKINNIIDLNKNDIKDSYFNSLSKIMNEWLPIITELNLMDLINQL